MENLTTIPRDESKKHPPTERVKVQTLNFSEIFKNWAYFPLRIDSYQRPYVWSSEKGGQLFNDLLEYLRDQKEFNYYMGSILLHRDSEKESLFIIDGQQRLTTLSILYHLVTGGWLDNMKMEYRSPKSVKNILAVKYKLHKLIQGNEQLWQNLFEKITFTVITTNDQDLAFTFFDTQNNRGVKLFPTDLLKAYHLRAIITDKDETIIGDAAKRWEKIQNGKRIFGKKEDFAAELFHQFLFRSRKWRGKTVDYFETDGQILEEFQKKALRNFRDNSVPLYAGATNTLGKSLELVNDKEFTLNPSPLQISVSGINLPFTLRQPVSEGLGFFLFAEKYAELVQFLFIKEEVKDPEVKQLRSFFHRVWEDTSLYLQEVFVLAVVMYYDKFKSEKLMEFALWLDHRLGAIRLEKKYIFREAAVNFLKNPETNLLDIISQAFIPEEVTDYLRKKAKNKPYVNEEITLGKGVQGQYLQRIQNYYDRLDFKNKKNWIQQYLETL